MTPDSGAPLDTHGGGVPMQARQAPVPEQADAAVRDAAPGRRRLVVAGNGMAGARAIEEVLSRGGDELFDITVFGAEPYGNYNRILLSNVLSGKDDAAGIFINPLEWYEENAITLHAGVRAAAIDRAARTVTGANGVVVPYDVLLIATGSRSFIPPLQGLNDASGAMRPGVFGFRTLDDCAAIIAAAGTSRKAVVIGGGLLGLEAARGLMNHGCEVHVVHLGTHLMEAQLDAPGGAILRTQMEAMGVRIHLAASTTAILGEDRVTGVAFKDGTTLDCDMVVISAGVRANVELGRECGLAVERAILVDDAMRSVDDPAVYVVGECAQHRGRVYGLVSPLWEQARVFADHVTGVDPDAAYTGSKLATKLKVMGVELASMGQTEPTDENDEVVQFTEPRRGTYKKLIVRDGRLVGGILMGDISKAAYLMQAYDRDSPLPHERLSLLFDIGGPPQAVTLDEMPADAQVCNCNGVSKATLGACVEAGERDPKAVMAATRAGMGCGSCKTLVGEVVAWFAARADADAPADEGTVSLVPRMVDGQIEVEELLRIGEVAKKYNVARVRLTEGRRIDFAGLSAEDGALLRAELEQA
ncbi:MAG: FAD-dependent oxidoreductase [Janthinobacterium lividum]